MKSSTDKNEMAINAVEIASKVEDNDEKMLYIGASKLNFVSKRLHEC